VLFGIHRIVAFGLDIFLNEAKNYNWRRSESGGRSRMSRREFRTAAQALDFAYPDEDARLAAGALSHSAERL
jgi:hypothetical protein